MGPRRETVERIFCRIQETAYVQLQWGHGAEAVESGALLHGQAEGLVASMGPQR